MKTVFTAGLPCLLLAILSTVNSNTYAGDSVSFSAGQAKDEVEAVRLSARRYWQVPIWQNDVLAVSGYWDASIARWHQPGRPGSAQDDAPPLVYALAIAPVFRVELANWRSSRVTPFVDIGVGATFITATALRSGTEKSRMLGSRLQFQDIGALGIRFGRNQEFELAYQYIHYSNLDLASHNAGVDSHLLNLVWQLGPKD